MRQWLVSGLGAVIVLGVASCSTPTSPRLPEEDKDPKDPGSEQPAMQRAVLEAPVLV